MTYNAVPNTFQNATSSLPLAQLDADFVYVSAKLVSVKDYGAVGNGSTNDTASIQAAITALVAAGGGRLYFPAGIYQVSSALNISGSVSLMGEGEYVTFLRTTSATAPILNITLKGSLEITELTLTASVGVPRTAGYFIDINDTQVLNVYIGHVSFSGYFGGIRWAGVSSLDIDQCQFLNGVAGAATGIRIDAGSDICIRHCLWSAAAQIANGIYVTSAGDLELIDIDVIQGGNCLVIDPPNGGSVPSVEATTCFFDHSTNGIVVLGTGTGSFARSKFTNCWFGSMSARGVLFNSSGAVTDGITFAACDFYACTVTGLDFFSGTASQNIGVIGCNFAGNGTAINVGTNHAKTRIENCHIGPHGGFAANTNGIFCNGAYSDYTITGNYISGNGTNLTVGTPGSNVVIENNDGFVTKNRGTATVATGTTSITVNHGLGVTPVSGEILATPIKTLASAAFFWVDTITSTQFTIHTNVNPAANVDFAWQARSLGS